MELTIVIFSVLLIGLFFLVAIPFVLVGLVLGTFFFVLGQLIALPFRLLGWTVGLGAGVLLFFVKLFLLFLVACFVMIGILVGFLPLLPLALILLGLWLILRPGRSGRAGQGRPATT